MKFLKLRAVLNLDLSGLKIEKLMISVLVQRSLVAIVRRLVSCPIFGSLEGYKEKASMRRLAMNCSDSLTCVTRPSANMRIALF